MTRNTYVWIASLAGAAVVIGSIAWLLLGYLYAHTENENFERLRAKSELDCGSMPLHCLVRDGDGEAVARYVAEGGDLERRDNWGQSALFWAVQHGRDPMVQTLLAAGLNPSTRDDTEVSVLYRALTGLRYDMADALMEFGADVNALNGAQNTETILHFCVTQNRLECVEYLLRHGADPTLEDSFGYTPLRRAELYDHIDPAIAHLLRG